jgi:hypothetical protein
VTVTYSAPNEAPRKKSRSALLPLLILLFLVSYSILTLLVIEQGRTIESQRSLLREMLKDSTQLAELKGKLARQEAQQTQVGQPEQTPAQAQTQPEQKEPAAGKTPAPSPDKAAKRPGKSAHSLRIVPQKPAADLEDVRRSTRVI